MALDNQINSADAYGQRRRRKKNDNVGREHIKYINTMLYKPGSREDKKWQLAGTIQLVRAFEEHGSIRNLEEFHEFAKMLGVEEWIDHAIKLFSTR